MKLWLRFFLGASLVLAAATVARAAPILSVTSVASATGYPGDAVTFGIGISNSGAATPADDFSAISTADFRFDFVNTVTGYAFSATALKVFPVALIQGSTTPAGGGSPVPGTGSFNVTTTLPTKIVQAGSYYVRVTMTSTTYGAGSFSSGTFDDGKPHLSVTGKPDFQITSLSYAAGTSYKGGDVIPMTMTFRNNISGNTHNAVPYVPGGPTEAAANFPTYFRISVVLSANPAFGDADDFQLTFFDISAATLATLTGNNGSTVLNADGLDRTYSWNQLLPGNFSGSYYVLAKINSLSSSQVVEDDPPVQTVNGNNIWAGNSLNPNATLINLLPSNFPTTSLVSQATGSNISGSGYSDNPSMSSDGRYVAFASDATNLVTPTTNGVRHVYLFDSQANTTRQLSKSLQGVQDNGNSNNPALSAGGGQVAFASDASNLIFGDTNGFSDIYAVNAVSGEIARVSVTSSGDQANNPSFKPAISTDGRYIAFESTATNLVPGVVRAITIPPGGGGTGYLTIPTVTITGGGATTNATAVATIAGGAVTGITLTSGGVGYNGSAVTVTIAGTTGTGATATAYVTPAVTVTPGVSHIYLRNRDVSGTGIFDTMGNTETTIVDVAPGAYPYTVANGNSTQAAISADGSHVAFASTAVNLTGTATTAGRQHVYERPIAYTGGSSAGAAVLGTTVLVSVRTGTTTEADGNSQTPSLSAKGEYVAFASLADDLLGVGIDTNGVSDIFVYDNTGKATNGTVTRVSTPDPSTALTQGTDPMGSVNPTISSDGRFVTFASLDNNLTAGDAIGRYLSGPTGATATATVGGGAVTLVNVATSGSGYTKVAPIVRIDSKGAGATAAATISGGAITGFTVLNQGDGKYVSAPTVVITGGGATTNATATATINGSGFVTGLTLAAPNFGGAGYTSQPLITISSGNNATATATMKVTGIVVTGGGSGYTSAPTVTITGGGGTGATATATVTGGVVTGLTLGANGSGYTSAPSVAFSNGGGTGATAIVSMGVNAIGVTNGGTGYTSAPTITILSGGDADTTLDIFVHDRDTATSGTFDANVATTLVSANRFGYQTYNILGIPSTSASNIYPVISSNGRFVAFPSDAENVAGLAFGATNLLYLDSNSSRDVFIADRRTTVISSGNGNTPTVTITSPGTGSSVYVNNATTITASAIAVVGVVANVQFYVNGAALGAPITVFPYQTTWTPTAVGSTFTLSAIVTDSFGNQGISPNITVHVNAQPSVGISVPLTQMTLGDPAQTATATASANTPGSSIQSVTFIATGPAASLPGGVNTITLGAPPYTTTFNPSVSGTYTLQATAKDSPNGDNGQSTIITVIVNPVGGGGGGTTPPTVTLSPLPPLTSPVNVPVVLTATATAAGSASIQNVKFLVNGVTQSTTSSAPYTYTFTPSSAGAYVLTVQALDSLNTQGNSTPFTLTVGGVAPTVSFGSAIPATLPVNIPYNLTATATPGTGSGTTITQVQYFANTVSIGTATAFPYLVTWTPAGTGTYTVTAVATDNMGNKSLAATSIVTVNTGTSPTITLTSPNNNAAYSVGDPITLAATTNLGAGLVSSVQFFVNGVQTAAITAGVTGGTLPLFTAKFTPAAGGSYTFVAVVTDIAGNRTTSSPATVTVSTGSVPTVSLAPALAGASFPVNTSQILSATVIANGGSITGVEFFANGLSLGKAAAFPYAIAWTPTGTGVYSITAVATDSQGNITTSAMISVTATGSAGPAVSVVAPVASSTIAVNTPQTLTATASSLSGFITSVQFYVNGLPFGAAVTAYPYSTPWTPTSTGTYSIKARATDSFGNITDSVAIGLTVATTPPPVVSITNPVNGSSYTVGTALSIGASASDPAGTITQVKFLVNGVALPTVATISPYFAAWTPGSVGTYTLTAQATDNTGNVTTSAPVTVTIGANAPPTVSLTSPAAGISYALGNQVLVAASASDSDGTVASVQFFANGLSIGTVTAAPFNTSWRPKVAGTYTLTAVATDNSGNLTTSASVSVTVTSVGAPTATIVNPIAGQTYSVGNSIPFIVTTSGGNGPIALVQFFVNGAPLGSLPGSPYVQTWKPLAAGNYSLLAVATDSAGISSNSPALAVVVNPNAPPTVALTGPATNTTVNSGTPINFTATAADIDGSVASVVFLVNGNLVGSSAASPFTAAWTPTAAGSYAAVAQATDNSGNVTTSAAINISVSANQPPAIALASPTSGTVLRAASATTINATASDTDGTIASVQFFANGVAIGAPITTISSTGYYTAQWTPASGGIYTLTATAIDNSGAATSTTSTVLALSAASGGGDTVFTGSMFGLGETGRFAIINASGKSAAFIGYSTLGAGKVYFYPSIPVDASRGFTLSDSTGKVLIAGSVGDTAATITTLDGAATTLIGVVTFPTGTPVASGYYTGSIAGRPASQLATIVGPDGSITLFATDGSVRTAGAGTVSATGAFTNIPALGGGTFTGKADPATKFLTGNLTGPIAGGLMGAIESGVSFSDGFLRNLSSRGQVGSGSNILIAGFVVGGTTPKNVLIRAIGPSLTQFGITGALADSYLQLFGGTSGTTQLAANDNWGGSTALINASKSVGAFSLSTTSLDSLLLVSLAPGNYTAQVSGVSGATGTALVELYDVDNPTPYSTQKVTNISTRALVGTGQNILIAGFVVNGNTPKKLLIRAVGPSLAPYLVAGTTVLADPFLRIIRNSDNLVVRENDNWETGNDISLVTAATVSAGAFPLASGGKDAVILINLPPGTYSAQVSGNNATTGVALVEVYEVP